MNFLYPGCWFDQKIYSRDVVPILISGKQWGGILSNCLFTRQKIQKADLKSVPSKMRHNDIGVLFRTWISTKEEMKTSASYIYSQNLNCTCTKCNYNIYLPVVIDSRTILQPSVSASFEVSTSKKRKVLFPWTGRLTYVAKTCMYSHLLLFLNQGLEH